MLELTGVMKSKKRFWEPNESGHWNVFLHGWQNQEDEIGNEVKTIWLK